MSSPKQLSPEELEKLSEQLIAKQRELEEQAEEIEKEKERISITNHKFKSQYAREVQERERELVQKLENASKKEIEAERLLERARTLANNPELFQIRNEEDLEEQLNDLKTQFNRLQVSLIEKPPNSVRVTIKDALAYITPFDGSSITVSQFIRSCKRAKGMLTQVDEPLFLELLRQKLTGRARTALEYSEYNTLENLETQLRNIFDPYRTVNQTKAELENVILGSQEAMLDYINRVQALHGDIIYAEQTECGRQLTANEIDKIDAIAKEAFLNGIPPLLRLEINTKNPMSLENTYQIAMTVYKNHNRDKIRFGIDNALIAAAKSTPKSQTTNPGSYSNTHLAPNLVADLNSVSPHCNYCNHVGHTVERCYKRQNDISRKNDPRRITKCEFCRKLGHSLINCRNFERIQRKKEILTQQGNGAAPPAQQGPTRGTQKTDMALDSKPSTSARTDTFGSRTSN